MNEQERITDLQRHSATLDSRLTTLETNFAVFTQEMKDFKQEMKDFKQEMRDRDNQRHAEISELRNMIKEIYTTTDAKITDIKNSIDTTNKHIQNFSIAAFVGVGAMAITSIIGVSAMVYSILNK